MITLTNSEVDNIKYLSELIQSGNAGIDDYNRYEQLLLSAGITQHEIRSKMYRHGFDSYEDYIVARRDAVTLQEKRVTRAIVSASLVALYLVVLYLIVQQQNDTTNK